MQRGPSLVLETKHLRAFRSLSLLEANVEASPAPARGRAPIGNGELDQLTASD